MPPLTFLFGFGFVWRLIMFTPSTTRRLVSGVTLRTRPRLPRSLPVITSTLSFFLIGVASRDISNLHFTSDNSQCVRSEHFGRERDDLHEAALAQFAGDGPEDARADRLALIVDEHGGVPIEPDVRAVAPALLLDGPHDDRLHDRPLLDGRLGRRFLHRRGDDVAEARVAPGGAADRVDDRNLARAGVIGDVQDRSHL